MWGYIIQYILVVEKHWLMQNSRLYRDFAVLYSVKCMIMTAHAAVLHMQRAVIVI